MKNNENYLKQYSIVKLKGERYKIFHLSEFEMDGCQLWQEYTIADDKWSETKWLKIRKNENNEEEYWVCEKYYGKADSRKEKIEAKGINYYLEDSGTVIANKKYGEGYKEEEIFDLKMKIKKMECDYTDYISEDLKNRISIQRFKDKDGTLFERIVKIEKYVEKNEIELTNEIEKSKIMLKEAWPVLSILIICMSISVLMPVLLGFLLRYVYGK